MLKIAYIGQKGILNPQGGGVETHVEELSVRMAKKGYQVYLYTRPHYTPKEYTRFEGVELVSVPSIYSKHLDTISHTLFSIINAMRKGVDIIHIHGVGPSFWSFIPRIFAPSIKVISTAHSADWEHGKWNSFAKMCLKAGAWVSAKTAHEVISVSKEMQKRFLTLYKRSISLIPNGVNVWADKKIDSNLLSKYNLQKDKYILVVSRLIKHKGIHYLIEAFKHVKSTNPELQDFKLVIVGQTSFSNTYFTFLKKLIDGREDIVFTGAQRGQTLEQLFANAYMYSSPSMSEGLSISLLEAMSYSKAVLVSDIEENLDLIAGDSTTGSVGFAFQNKNILDLASKLEILLKNPHIVNKVGSKAKEYVKTYYNWADIATRTEKLYLSSVTVKDKTRTRIFAFARS